MGKKAKTEEPVADPPVEEPKVEDPPKEEPKVEEKKEEEKVELKKKEDKKPKVIVEEPVREEDDDLVFIKQTLAKQMIDSLDVDTLKKYVVECEGKSLKAKAEWIAQNKPVPAPDPKAGLPKGPAGGKTLGRYDPGYKHDYNAKN